MQKSILAVALTVSAIFASPVFANPIELLTNQCEQLDYADKFRQNFENNIDSIALQARTFDRQTLGMNNLVDQLSHYLDKPLPMEIRDSLLGCQIRLADEIASITASEAYQGFIHRLEQSDEAQLQALATALAFLKASQLDLNQKARLHSAEASFLSSRHRGGYSLALQGECALTDNERASGEAGTQNTSAPPPLDKQIASYLLKQPNGNCRELVWKAFQGRGHDADSDSSIASLKLIATIRQEQAHNAGFPSYAHLMLSNMLLANTHNAAEFLALTRPTPTLAPWNIGRALAESKGDRYSLLATDLLQQLFHAAKPYGIEVEELSTDYYRLWLHGRLIGELVATRDKQAGFALTRRSIFTRQFAWGGLELPETVKGRLQARALIDAFSEAIAQMASTEKFYLLSRDPAQKQRAELAAAWFSLRLEADMENSLQPLSPREAMADAHGLSQAYYRAALALNFYSSTDSIADNSTTGKLFADHFDGQWQDSTSQYQSVTTLVREGPLAVQSLWTQRLSHYLVSHSTLDNHRVFSMLMVNGEQETLPALLEQILGRKLTTDELIRDIANELQ